MLIDTTNGRKRKLSDKTLQGDMSIFQLPSGSEFIVYSKNTVNSYDFRGSYWVYFVGPVYYSIKNLKGRNAVIRLGVKEESHG